jgi:hypothetical protein
MIDVSAFAVVLDAEAPLTNVVSGHDIGADGLVSAPRSSEGVGREAGCGLLNERLQDVSVCFVAFVRLSIDDCNCELFISFDVGSILIEGGQ